MLRLNLNHVSERGLRWESLTDIMFLLVSKYINYTNQLALPPGALCNMRYLFETHLQLKSHPIMFAYNLCRIYHCRALCKISKRLDNWNRFYGRMRFREISVWDEFWMDILSCTDPYGVNFHSIFFQTVILRAELDYLSRCCLLSMSLIVCVCACIWEKWV